MTDPEPVHIDPSDPEFLEQRHDMECGHGHHYSVTGRTMAVVMDLAEYARVQEINAHIAQWLDDLAVTSPREIIMACERKTVGRLLHGGDGRADRKAWREVAAALGAVAPFDVQPDTPKG